MALHTTLCERLGIEHPIVQSGMGRIAGPDLVAAVSNAGGLGVLAGLFLPAEDLRRDIRRVRALTDRPFGVNLWLHPALLPPPDPKAIAPHQLRTVQSALNSFRARLGLPENQGLPDALPDIILDAFEALVDERVQVWSIGLGQPTAEQSRRCH